ncbi:NAD(P)/FAD-dependent oxidoreductase [Gulosibacter sp. 10]|uniref:flavin monoamine oxidase family protein n=1 Tax=Gulosibacter sp. 10 TaxID=1255570 RepID=UPI000B34CE9B|nr:NAD(P)/FAD-dependent oxidoreductase [Gulosibacter sp. 10]
MTDVVIIGAGSAGMTAAHRLTQAGANVTVLEARARVGGRTWSEPLENGEIAERGGEYFESSMTDVFELAEELGLTMTTQGFNPTARPTTDPDGPGLEALAAASRTVVEHWAGLDRIGPDTSIQDVLDGAGLDPELAAVLRGRMSCHRSALISNISAYWSEGPESAAVEEEHHVRIRGGNQQLAERMADRVGRERILLRRPVGRVEPDGAGYLVTGMTGETIRADAVIVAVPVGVLKQFEIEGLDPRTRAAIRKIGFGDAAKLHLAVRGECPPGIRQDVSRPYSTWAPAAVGRSDAAYVTGFSATHETQRKLGIAEGPELFRRRLHADWPELDFTGGSLFTYWGADPWTRGAYSYRPLGWSAENDEFIAAPNGRILFAGEHTADIHRSLICGAIRSGERAAREALERL